MDIPENGNIISRIGVRAVPNSGLCKNVRVELNGCRAFIDDTEVIGSREEEGVEVRRMCQLKAGDVGHVSEYQWTDDSQPVTDLSWPVRYVVPLLVTVHVYRMFPVKNELLLSVAMTTMYTSSLPCTS